MSKSSALQDWVQCTDATFMFLKKKSKWNKLKNLNIFRKNTFETIEWIGLTPCVEEIKKEVGKLLSLGDDALNLVHKENSAYVSFSLAWARNYLLGHGLLEKSMWTFHVLLNF